MALKTYVGARYAPKFMGAWNKTNEYAALSVVYHDNQSYVSRKTVPAETEITNTEFWIRSSDWNAQVDEYRNQVDAYDEKVVQYNQNVEAYNTSVNNFFEETIHAYNTKEDMVNDESIKLGYTLITCGETSIGDGSGAFYQAVSETSSGAVALKNGLFAKKFQLMPERFNRYTVDNINEVLNLTLSKGDIITNTGATEGNNTNIYAPCVREKSYPINGTIKRCEFDREYPKLSYAPHLGDMSYFFIKTTMNTYLRFKVIEFVPIQTAIQNATKLYLFPDKICTNETPTILPASPSVVLGNISDTTTYTLHMHGTSKSEIIILVTEIGASSDATSSVTIKAFPTDFYVTLKRDSKSNQITAMSYHTEAQGIATCNISKSGNTVTVSDINGFMVDTPIEAEAGVIYTFMLGVNGLDNLPYVNEKPSIVIRQILVPFHTSGTNIDSRFNVSILGAATPITQFRIPAGRSVMMLSAKYAKDTGELTATFTQIW